MRRLLPAMIISLVLLAAGCNNQPDPPTVNGSTPPATTATSPPTTPSTGPVTPDGPFLTNFAPQGYDAATGEVFGNRRDLSGAYNAYAVDVHDPARIRSLTAGNPLYGTEDTHRGVSDVSPDGRYMILTVENPARWPFWQQRPHADEAQPGKGAYNDVWLATTDGLQAWPLTDPSDPFVGVFWARFDATGSRVVFAKVVTAPNLSEYFGGERMVVASIDWTNGVPHLTQTALLGNGAQFYEPYGFSPDGKAVVAVSDEPVPGQPGKAQVLLFPLDGSAPTRLTKALGDGYQEFAFLRPDHSGYVISSGFNGWFLGTDRWLVSVADPEGTPTRVTRFADYTTGHPQSGISGGMAFVSNDVAVVGFGGFGTASGLEDAYTVSVPT